MANTYAVYNSGNILIEYWCGDVFFSEISELLSKQDHDSRIQSHTCEIVDFRDANLILTNEEITNITSRLKGGHKSKKIALIINNPSWDVACSYSRFAWSEGIELLAFLSLDAACAWIEFDTQHIQTKLSQLKAGLWVELEGEL